MWLETPQVRRWYPDEDYIEDLEDNLEDPRICGHIVLKEGQPFAYLQDYDIHAWPDHPLRFLPQGARGLDTFIGTADHLHRGWGSAYLRAFADRLFARGVPALGIDPHPDNGAAISAYAKVGFQIHGEQHSEWGPVLVMSMHAP